VSINNREYFYNNLTTVCPDVFILKRRMAIRVNTNIIGPYNSPTTVCKKTNQQSLFKILTDIRKGNKSD